MSQVQARFVGEMLHWRDTHPEQGIALVSHADPIKFALTYFLGSPLDFYDRIEIALASVSVVTIDSWSAKVQRLNDRPAGTP
jgi:broad specificity phosphatase PhoE